MDGFYSIRGDVVQTTAGERDEVRLDEKCIRKKLTLYGWHRYEFTEPEPDDECMRKLSSGERRALMARQGDKSGDELFRCGYREATESL